MQFLYDPGRRNPHCAHEQFSFLLDNDIDELWKLSLGIIVICFPRISPHSGKEKVHTEGSVLVFEK